MAIELRGAPVAEAITEKLISEVEQLKKNNTYPTLAIVRVGEKGDDIAYERGATKRCNKIGINVESIVIPEDSSQDSLVETLKDLNANESIHGILLFRPLPKTFDDNLIRNMISPEKDVDGITDASATGIYTQNGTGFPPCTATACMEILDYYNIDISGKKTVVIGRSLVIGKPVSMMLLAKNATVTICHSKTSNIADECKSADIVIVSAGKAGFVNKDFLREGQTIIDVGINVDEEGNLCGDVVFADAIEIADNITPVPGGVGTVTSSILAKHVVEAASKNS